MVGAAALLVACGGQKPETKMTEVKRYDLKDFFKNPEKSSYQISPNGEYFSYMAPFQDRMNVFIQKAGEAQGKRITEVTDRDIAGYTWANDNRILYLKDNGGDENWALYGVDIDGQNFKPLTQFDSVTTQFVDDLDGLDDYIMVALNKRNPQIFDPYRLNIVTGELEMLAENPGNIQNWQTDHDGKLRMASTTDGVNTSLLYRATEKDKWETIMTTNFKESVSPLFFTFDNKNIYASSNVGRDKSAIVLFDLAEKKEKEILFEHPEVDVDALYYSKKRKVLTSISYTTDKRHRKFLDKEMEAWFGKLETALPGYEIGISGMNKAENKAIIRTYSDRSLGSYYFYDIANDKLTKIEDVAPWINEDDMAEMTPIQYKSRDGLTINGYLTLPKGKEAKNLPLVVNVHGGPWARDDWGYNPEVQFLANRGFAVLQMNFRGSTGYGREFWEASFKQWGQDMQNDVTDGAQWAIGQGIADKDRIAIYGASYGGYATLAGLAYTPDLYACGVDYVGVSNLFTFMQTIPPYWKPFLAMMYEMVGDLEADSALLAAYSPALNADKIKAPLFIAQGAKDPRVNVAESDQMVEAMQARGVEVEYLVKDNEGHGFRNEENRFEFYEAMSAFLEKHIGDQNVAVAE
ncbi:MAG: S9 family peptidase [Flavobacteriales bacterium]|nr:S9 family peptidase [Flavobacteriales bacterium]